MAIIARSMNELLKLKPELDTTTDATSFLARNGATAPFDGYVGSSQMQFAAKDSIQRLGINQVYGPYLDGNTYVLAKMLDIKNLPDSVKCRHILLGTADRQGNPLLPDSVAKKIVDSIALAIKNGANFDLLNVKYSTDEVAKTSKGEMTFSSSTIQGEGFAKEFGQFILFDGKPGDKKVVKTQFGWHYIEILSFISPQPSYKVAYLAQEIVASQETDNTALNKANQFAGDSKDLKSFDETYEKTIKAQGIIKGVGINIKPNDGNVQGMSSRTFVKNIYAAKRGEVLKPERIGNDYVVAVVTDIFEEGTKKCCHGKVIC
jgi:peptidyl-prolyl cis-trans isomerase D